MGTLVLFFELPVELSQVTAVSKPSDAGEALGGRVREGAPVAFDRLCERRETIPFEDLRAVTAAGAKAPGRRTR